MKIFIDTNILVEYLKGKNTDFLESLLTSKHDGLFINQVVWSEFLFHYLALISNKSPLSVKMANEIASTFNSRNPFDMLPGVMQLSHSKSIGDEAFELMNKFNLLPNDALILATCKFNDIGFLATYDTDFEIPCKKLGIEILKNSDDIRN